MNETALAHTASETSSRLPGPKLLCRRAALTRKPYSILVTFSPFTDPRYAVHIRPGGKQAVSRTAYFCEGDLKYALAQCFPEQSAAEILARVQSSGVCDLRRKDTYLDVARAAALGWYS